MKQTYIADKYKLNKGDLTIIPNLYLQTNPAVWGEDANQFKPDRFNKQERGQNLYLFGEGDITSCLGTHLMYISSKSILFTLLYIFDIARSEHLNGDSRPVMNGFMLGPKNKLCLTFTSRIDEEEQKDLFTKISTSKENLFYMRNIFEKRLEQKDHAEEKQGDSPAASHGAPQARASCQR